MTLVFLTHGGCWFFFLLLSYFGRINSAGKPRASHGSGSSPELPTCSAVSAVPADIRTLLTASDSQLVPSAPASGSGMSGMLIKDPRAMSLPGSASLSHFQQIVQADCSRARLAGESPDCLDVGEPFLL